MNNRLSMLLALSALTHLSVTRPTMVEYVEDAYVQQAPQEIVNLAQEAATLVGFEKPYEVIVPKKAGIQINPWNSLVTCVTNPITQNWFVLANPAWFSSLPHDQQIFLLSRCFMYGQRGIVPPIAKFIPWIFILFSWVLIFLIYLLLGKTMLGQYHNAVRILLAFCIVTGLNFALFNKVQVKLLDYLYVKHDTAIHQAIIEKTGNRQAALDALQACDTVLQESIKKGETFFVPFEHIFSSRIDALKNTH